MTTSSMPVKLKAPTAAAPNPTADRIVWNGTPLTGPLFLSRLTISRNSAIDTNSVVGHITPGSSSQGALCTLFAGNNKFAILKSNCDASGLIENITYDANLDVSDVTSTVMQNAHP